MELPLIRTKKFCLYVFQETQRYIIQITYLRQFSNLLQNLLVNLRTNKY